MGYGLKFLYPHFCCACKIFLKDDSIFCQKCFEELHPIQPHSITIKRDDAFESVIKVLALSGYVDPLKTLILNKSRSCDLSFKYLGRLIYERTDLKESSFDCIVPVPLHWLRNSRRGFNQAHVMAKTLGKLLNVPVMNLLKRSKRTVFQRKLSRGLKEENVSNSFGIRWEYEDVFFEFLENKSVLIVDDLFTTGATLKSVASVLLMAKPKKITAVVACRATEIY